jgi:glycosyltransferase involved in cell wall biosynthesis
MKISVIVPTYQHANVIHECLNNIFAQSKKPHEVIVVNDGSTDKTAEVLLDFQDRITLINQANQGANVARNRGFEASSGEAVIFCDSDVIMRGDMLEKMTEALRSAPEADYAYSDFKFGFKTFPSKPFDPDLLKKQNYIHTTSLIKRDAFPGFDPNIKRLQDWDLWLTMLEDGKRGEYVPERLFHVETDSARESISSWVPSFLYKIPWPILGYTPKAIEDYERAKEVIIKKHDL